MGKGDQRSKKGKRSRGSYGNARPKKKAGSEPKRPPRRPAPRGR